MGFRVRSRFLAAFLLLVMGVSSGPALAQGVTAPNTATETTTAPTQDSTIDCGTTDGGPITALADDLSQPSSCWSCELYGAVYNGMHALVQASYAEFTDVQTGGILLVVTILGSALILRILPFFVTQRGEYEMIAGIRMFLFRIVVVFSGILLVPASTAVGAGGMVSDFMIDGPLAMGTAIGEILSASTMSAFQPVGGAAVAGGTSETITSLFGTPTDLSVSSSTPMYDFGAEHVAAAQQMLYNMHELGAIGIVISAWLLVLNPYGGNFSSGSGFAVFTASLYMLFVFFKFTFAFGMRYVDALVRSMIIFSLTPLFAVLWIFDSTRQMSVQALRSGLALAGVFAVSGLVYTVAFFIMFYGYQNAFNNQGLNFSGIEQLLCSMNSGAVESLTSAFAGSNGNSSNSMNWMAFFYLVGSATMATACASLPFEVSQQIFAFSSADMGVADKVAGDLRSTMTSLVSGLRR